MRKFPNILFLSLALSVLGAAVAMAQARPGGMPPQNPSTAEPNSQSNPNNPNNPNYNPNTATGNTAHVDDKKFAKEAALGGLEEVELGKLAQQKASSDAVKQFGQRMIDDHTKANDQLKEIASKENITLPDALDKKHQSEIDKLSKLSGPDFDKAYVKDMVKDHEKDLNEFKSEAQGGTDPNIKQFASGTLPTLQQHLDMAKDLNKNEKSKKTSGE